MERLRRKKQIKLNKEMLKTSILKIVVILLIVGLNWTGLSAISNTFAYFDDNEDSNDNLYQAGILDFSLNSPADFSPSNLTTCIPVNRDISIVNNGNIFQYTVQPAEFSGDLCGDLNLIAKLDGVEKYNGSLTSFNYGPIEFSAQEDWNFEVGLTSSDLALQNKNCQFKFIFEGWQTNLPDSSVGFFDIEEIINNVTTGDWLPQVEVTYPDGGEHWYLVPLAYVTDGFGRYEITWTATSPVYDDNLLDIDIWFCDQSGANCFYKIATSTDNDGSYWWTIPYESRFITDEARIKVVATDPCTFTAEDMSDADFCPPMLTEAEILEMLGSVIPPPQNDSVEENQVLDLEEEPVVEETTTTDATTTDATITEATTTEATTTEATTTEATTTEATTTEATDEGSQIDVEETTETAGETTEPVIEEPPAEEEPFDSAQGEPTEEPITEEEPIIEEEIVVEETPVIEEEPVTTPDNPSVPEETSEDNSDDGGDVDII